MSTADGPKQAADGGRLADGERPADAEPPSDGTRPADAERPADDGKRPAEGDAPADAGGSLGPVDIHVRMPAQEPPAPPSAPLQTPYGEPGLPLNRAHPFYVGFMGAVGVLTAYFLLSVLGRLSHVITLIVVALFLALGLEPIVAGLQRRGLRRGWAVSVVFVGVITAFVAFAWAVVPTLVTQAAELTTNLPAFVEQVQRSAVVQRLDREYGIVNTIGEQLQQRLASGETVLQVFGGVFGAGVAVVSGAFSAFTVLVLTLYFTASLRILSEGAYRLVPATRRPRVQLLADEIIRRIGGYIAGQVAVASINAGLTYVVLVLLRLPYALVLAIAVGILGLIPLVGATLGAVVVVSVALFHSWQYALVVGVYYTIYQQVENYVIAPRIMQRTVSVPTFVAIIAALAGGTLLGVVGALMAIPVAAGILLIVQEVVVPRQERH